MYALRSQRGRDHLVDPRILEEFGDYFALLINADGFFDRINSEKPTIHNEIDWGLVEYLDEQKYEGPVGVFRKSAEFSYQSEFRIAITPGMGRPYTLDVGDLSDITISGPTMNLNRMLKVELVDGRERLFCAKSIGR
jgi:hypothetical protein